MYYLWWWVSLVWTDVGTIHKTWWAGDSYVSYRDVNPSAAETWIWPGNKVTTMAAVTLAPHIARPSAAIILTLRLTGPLSPTIFTDQHHLNDEEWKCMDIFISFMFPEINSAPPRDGHSSTTHIYIYILYLNLVIPSAGTVLIKKVALFSKLLYGIWCMHRVMAR